MVINFEGIRLKEARRFRQLTIQDLADFVGVSKQMISKYEKGDAKPSIEVYQKLVLKLGFPLKFYQQKDNFNFIDKGTFYRSRYSSTQAEKKPSEYLKKYFALLCDFFEEYIDFPSLPIFEFSDNPVIAAQQLREYWNLGEEPINNIVSLLEQHGFHIAAISSSSEKVDAFGSYVEVQGNNQYCILIDKENNNFYRQQFSLAHELGHWVLHSSTVDPIELTAQEHKDIETEANLFASSFLLPKIPFSKDVERIDINIDNFISLKTRWNVSMSSMIYRSKTLDLISPDEYLRLQKRISARGYRKQEPFDNITEVPKPVAFKQSYDLMVDANLFHNTTLQSMIENKYNISIPNFIIADLLGISSDDLENNENKIVQFINNN